MPTLVRKVAVKVCNQNLLRGYTPILLQREGLAPEATTGPGVLLAAFLRGTIRLHPGYSRSRGKLTFTNFLADTGIFF